MGVVLQPVGFVTFNSRAMAEEAKQELQVHNFTSQPIPSQSDHRIPLSGKDPITEAIYSGEGPVFHHCN